VNVEAPAAVDLAAVDRILRAHEHSRGTLIAILTDIQRECSYLPRGALEMVAERLGMPFSRVFGVSTFYKAFSLEPRGRCVVQVCMGTACHVRGAQRILEEFQRVIGVGPGMTTEDRLFTLETVNCVGACALGPVAVVDGRYHGNLTLAGVTKLVDRYAKELRR
jgi:NADH-quinone oxidoreductase subunit E